MPAIERVTITLPTDLVKDIDRREKNSSKFVAEAVRNELDRRRRAELHRSLQNPHPESAELTEQGLAEWARGLPEEDTDLLVDAGAGSPSGGCPARAGRRGASEPRPRCPSSGSLTPTVGYEQRGMRPCIVVSDPDVVADHRFPLVCVVPVTGT
jgi:hypothetical protein